jgi:hypothetical protein
MDKPRIMILKAPEKHEMPRTLFIHKEPTVAAGGAGAGAGARPRNTVHMPAAGGAGVALPGAVVAAPKRAGRPSKEELRKEKLASASAAIAALAAMEPKKKDVAAFMRARIADLTAEKA